MTCVSLKHKEYGPHMWMRKNMDSFPTPWMSSPWMPMMKPCVMEEQGAFLVGDLDGEISDVTLDGSNSLGKGET